MRSNGEGGIAFAGSLATPLRPARWPVLRWRAPGASLLAGSQIRPGVQIPLGVNSCDTAHKKSLSRRIPQCSCNRLAERNALQRRGGDSNPRYGYPHTAFPVLHLQPLGHLTNLIVWPKRVSSFRACNSSNFPKNYKEKVVTSYFFAFSSMSAISGRARNRILGARPPSMPTPRWMYSVIASRSPS